jgi:hypothetical protein
VLFGVINGNEAEVVSEGNPSSVSTRAKVVGSLNPDF